MIGIPVHPAERPRLSQDTIVDPLSDVLRSVRLKGGVFLDARFTAPWCVTSYVAAEDCKPMLANPAQMISYHFMTEGRMLVSAGNEPPIEVQAGEIVLLPRNDVHQLASEPGLMPVAGRDLIQPSPNGGLARATHGGGGASARIICGFLASDDAFNPLIASLPRILKIDVRESTSRNLIEASLEYAVGELADARLSALGDLARVSELLFVEAVRRYAGTAEANGQSWLKGVSDPQLGRALALIHRDIAKNWTADELAREAALSRSAFMSKFIASVGMPPIRYLTVWRLRMARMKLAETPKGVAQVAFDVGYESEDAFSRAFKREFGASPAHWRAEQRQ
jgi:AraC-like DNA-binding protein